MSAVRIWVMAARVRTLPASVAPVLVGTSLALGAGTFHALAFVAALLGAARSQLGGSRLRRSQQLGVGPAPARSLERKVPASRRRRSREPSLDHHAHRLAVAFAA